jgi:hypothetical protein
VGFFSYPLDKGGEAVALFEQCKAQKGYFFLLPAAMATYWDGIWDL